MVDINVKQFKELMEKDGVCLLDVRTDEEYENGFIKNAIKYDIFDINFRDDILRLDRDKVYLVYCRSGQRSYEAMCFMEQNGFKAVFNLEGGILAWVQFGEELTEFEE